MHHHHHHYDDPFADPYGPGYAGGDPYYALPPPMALPEDGWDGSDEAYRDEAYGDEAYGSDFYAGGVDARDAPGAEGPIGSRRDGLAAERAETDIAGSANGVDVDVPPLRTPTVDARAAGSDWFEGFDVRGAYAGWSWFLVHDTEPDPLSGTTYERYDIEPLNLYRVDAALRTRALHLSMRYETDRGFTLGDGRSFLLDLALGFTAVPGLEDLSIAMRTLDFDHGRVDLVAPSGRLLSTTPLRVRQTMVDVFWALDENVRIFGRRLAYALPRNVYLEEVGDPLPRQISDQLLMVDATAWAAGIELAHADDGEGLFGGVRGWWGVGPYDITTIAGGSFLDGGWLSAGGLDLQLGYRHPLGAGFSVGVRDTFTVMRLEPMGLPRGIERDFRAEGISTDGWALQFGTTELVNGLHFDLTWSL